jgi:hypothetical protein
MITHIECEQCADLLEIVSVITTTNDIFTDAKSHVDVETGRLE